MAQQSDPMNPDILVPTLRSPDQDLPYLRQLHQFFSQSSDALMRFDATLQVTHANAAAGQLFGIALQQLVGIRLGEIAGFELLATQIESQVQLLFDGVPQAETRLAYTHPINREKIDVRLQAVGEAGRIEAVFATISLQPVASLKMHDMLDEVQGLFEGTGVGIVLVRDLVIVRCNARLEEILGYQPGELAGRPTSLLHFNSGRSASVYISVFEHLKTHDFCQREDCLRSRDGRPIWIEVVSRLMNRHRPEEGIVSIVLDITERKQQQEQLQNAMRDLKTIFDGTGAGIMLIDGGYLMRANPRLAEMLGYAPERLLFMHSSEFYENREIADRTAAKIDEVLRQESSLRMEEVFRRKDGSLISLDITYQCVEPFSPEKGVIAALMDITEHKQQEIQLANVLLELQTIFDGLVVGVVHVRNQRILRCNSRFEEIFGYEPGELVGQTTRCFYADDAEWHQVNQEIHNDLKAHLVRQLDYRLLRKDGQEIWCGITTRAVQRDSPEQGWVSVIADISDRRMREMQLSAAQREQALVFNTSPIGLALIRNRHVIRVNRAFTEMFGVSSDTGWHPAQAAYENDEEFERVGRLIQTNLQKQGAVPMELPIKGVDGRTRWVSAHVNMIEKDRPSAGYIVAFIDIEARKASEASLIETQSMLTSIIEHLPVMLSVKDASTRRIMRFNRGAEEITGWSRGEVIGKTVFDLYPNLIATKFDERERAVIQTRKPSAFIQELLPDANGKIVPVRSRLVPIRAVDGRVKYLMTIVEDLSDQREAELARNESEIRFHQFAEYVDEMFFITDPDRKTCHYVNGAYEKVWGGSVDELYQEPRTFLNYLDPASQDYMAEVMADERRLLASDGELLISHPALGKRWVHLRTFPVKTEGGHVRVFCIAKDVTERRERSEARVEEALRQRDVLVREVHHRIKNNLQGVAGLLEQAAFTKPEVAAQLNEVISQIQAIALVHGLHTNSSGEVALLPLIQAIVRNVARNCPASLDYETLMGQEILIPEREAVPLALVINELMSNALRYKRKESPLKVTITSVLDGIETKVVSIGELPTHFDLNALPAGAAGLGLAKALLPQSGAGLSVSQEGMEIVGRLALFPPIVRLS
ncbi:MAG: PAS domain S-box protein [Betaproteobacteria bacterium]|nr:PAS domain S-box protein [Betaproteobacteria bacterium]